MNIRFAAALLLFAVPAWGFFGSVRDVCERPLAKAAPTCAVTVMWDPQHPEEVSWTLVAQECTVSEADAMITAGKIIYADRAK